MNNLIFQKVCFFLIQKTFQIIKNKNFNLINYIITIQNKLFS